MSIFAERTEKNDKLMNEKEFFHVVMVYEQMPGTYNMYRWGIDSIFSTKEAAKRYIDTGNPDSDFDENEEEHLGDLDYWMRNYDCELYRGCLVVKRGFDDRPCYDGIWEVRFDTCTSGTIATPTRTAKWKAVAVTSEPRTVTRR